jgi:hypothetical protein
MRAFAALVCAAILASGAARASEAEKYRLTLGYDPASRQVTATAIVALKPEPSAKTIRFYLHDELTVSAITAGGKALAFRQEPVAYDYSYTTKASRVEVRVDGADLSKGLTIAYAGPFSPSAARSPSDYMRGDADGLYLRSYGYSLWFPIFAESGASFPPADFELTVSAPAAFHSVFVGQMLGRKEKAGIATETWQAKAVGPFDAQLTLRRFVVKQTGPVATYFLPDDASVAASGRIGALSRKLLAYYAAHYRGKAAGQTIHVVEEPEFGDTASGNVIGLQEKHWRTISEDGPEAVTLAHELVHAFVQTPTPVDDRLYAFELEGFPSYFHLPALASVLGEDWYQARQDAVQKAYLERRVSGKDRRGDALPPEKPILSLSASDVGTYKDVFVLNDRALLFWDFLRRKMARHDFDALVRDLTGRPHVTAADFFGLIATYAPNLQADAHTWLETTDFPDRLRRSGQASFSPQ